MDKLIKQQAEAKRRGDYIKLNEINKIIYNIREQHRKAKEKAREQERDNRTAERIENILTL